MADMYDARFEYDAPRFHDFEAGSPVASLGAYFAEGPRQKPGALSGPPCLQLITWYLKNTVVA
jgi:hypothetical protein